MPADRIYELDDNGKSSRPPSVGIWKDDSEAQTNAQTLLGKSALEIWCGDRKVATLKPSEA
jgi:hypothetical protein